MARDRPPGSPGTAIKPGGKPEMTLNPSRQDNGLKSIQQNAEDENQARDRDRYMHSESDDNAAGMVAE